MIRITFPDLAVRAAKQAMDHASEEVDDFNPQTYRIRILQVIGLVHDAAMECEDPNDRDKLHKAIGKLVMDRFEEDCMLAQGRDIDDFGEVEAL